MTINRIPTLSVIVANYNNETYIEQCLESILGQSYDEIEIIVSDDASTDCSPAIIRRYIDQYPDKIVGIFSKRNLGVARNRHKAIIASRGEYIATLDSDDFYYEREKLAREMKIIREYKEKGQDVIAFSNILLVNREGKEIGPQWSKEKIREGNLFKCILSRSCMIPRDFVMRKSAYWEAGGYDEGIPIYEDWDLKIRLAARSLFYYTGVYGTAYRRHGQGLSSVYLSEHKKWLLYIFNKNIHLCENDQKSAAEHEFFLFFGKKPGMNRVVSEK